MKVIALLFVLFLAVGSASGQIALGEYSQSYQEDEPLTIVVAIRSDNNSFWTGNSDSELFNKLARDSSFRSTKTKSQISRTTFDSAKVYFFVKGLNPANANAFEFRVIEYPSKDELVSWTTVNKFSDAVMNSQSAFPPMAYLGGYKTDIGKMLIVDVKKKADVTMATSGLVAWESIQPEFSGVYTNANFDMFLKRLQYPWSLKNSDDPGLEEVRLPAGDNNLVLFLNADIYKKEQVEYELIKNGSVVIPWKSNEFDNSFVWIKSHLPGKYVVNVRYTAQRDHVSSYSFQIETAWYHSTAFRIMVAIFVLSLLGGLILLVLFFRQRRQAQMNLIHRSKLQLELKSIYAQWNPHFVFNALGSIQGLINKKDVRGANQYLSDFARLMRESMSRSNRDSVSINEDLTTLETYLKLEQLRFGFQFHVHVDDAIDIYATDIPTQLLQPLIENAIKHGISARHDAGEITIQFQRANDALIVVIIDNGRGFEIEKASAGLGLKMTRDRIKLLNQLNPSQPLAMQIQSEPNVGTRIAVTFNHWFL